MLLIKYLVRIHADNQNQLKQMYYNKYNNGIVIMKQDNRGILRLNFCRTLFKLDEQQVAQNFIIYLKKLVT